ncbi:hypothetical protein FQA39_LY17463 [Lamprigera yunnana]|nr:hypothetical protein FQA39_LY17463 [Lamprigera yunnana]
MSKDKPRIRSTTLSESTIEYLGPNESKNQIGILLVTINEQHLEIESLKKYSNRLNEQIESNLNESEVILVSTTKKLQNKSSQTVKQSSNSVNIQTINKCTRDSDSNTEAKCTRNYATQINNMVSLENSTCMNCQTTLRDYDEKILRNNTSLFEEMQVSISANTCNSNTDDGNVLVSCEQLSSHSSNGNMSILSSNNQQCNIPVKPNPIRSSTQINATKKKCDFTTSAHNQGKNLTNLTDTSSCSNISFKYTSNKLNTTPNLKNILFGGIRHYAAQISWFGNAVE